MTTRTLNMDAPSGPVDCRVAIPEDGTGPGLVVVAGTPAVCAELAEEGYVVLAADAFRGELATSVPAAIVQVSSTPRAQIHADIDAALNYLRSRPEVDDQRVGVMGCCFGGSHCHPVFFH